MVPTSKERNKEEISMANVNQGVRSGNQFGRIANVDLGGSDTDKVALKPGFLIRLRDRFHLVEAENH